MPSDGLPTPDAPGRSQRYTPVSELARGGMAALQLARVSGPSGFTKYVVLKRILAKWADEHEFVEMFLDEARLAATLDHPNVVHVYDAGRDEEGPFFAMEYIHGEDLRGVLRAQARRGEPLHLRHVLTIGLGAAAGLHHAHERRDYDGRPLGIIHRDVSPSNIIVTFEGGVKVVDFGIAKASTSRHATRPSIRKGKIAYMSPEQCKGAPLDRRSDVFALGIVLHELCTGRRLFAGDNEFAIMNAIVNHDAIRPSKLRPDLPEGLERIIVRALRRSADERYPDARALQRDLERFSETEGLTPSATALSELLEDLFGPRAYPWESLATSPGQRTSAAEPTDPTAPTRAVGPDDVETRVAPSPPPEPAPTRRDRRRVWPWIVTPLGAGAVAWGLIAAAPGGEDEGPPPPARADPPAPASTPSEDAPLPPPTPEEPEADGSTGPAPESESAPEPADANTTGEPTPETTKPKATTRRRPRPRASSEPETPTEEPETTRAREPFDPDGPAPRRRDP